MQIVLTEKDLKGLNKKTRLGFYNAIDGIIRGAEDLASEDTGKVAASAATDEAQPKATTAKSKKTRADKKEESSKSANKEDVKAKEEATTEESEVEDEIDLGLEDEEKAPAKPRTRKEMFSALQGFCKADKANAKKVRNAISELGIAKVTDMTDEQMKQICEDMEI